MISIIVQNKIKSSNFTLLPVVGVVVHSYQCVAASEVFDKLHSLGVLNPGGRPGGLDAGPVFESIAVSRQFGVALLRLCAEGRGVRKEGENTNKKIN